VGIAYGIPAMLFALTCPFVYVLTTYMRKRGLIIIGWVNLTVAMLMIGGTKWIRGFNQPEFIFLGLVVIGLSAGMVSIPILPEMLEAIEDDEEMNQKYEKEVIENTISGLFITFQSIGETIGPILNSMLVKYFGFRRAFEIYATYLMIFFTLYFFFCGHYTIFRNPYSSTKSKEAVSGDEELNTLIKEGKIVATSPQVKNE
jgi:MFS family permease